MEKKIWMLCLVSMMGVLILNGCGKVTQPLAPGGESAPANAIPPVGTATPNPKPVPTPVGEVLLATSSTGLKVYRYSFNYGQQQGFRLRSNTGTLICDVAEPYDMTILNARFTPNSNYFAVLTQYDCPSNGAANALTVYSKYGDPCLTFDRVSDDEHNGRYLQILQYSLTNLRATITYYKWEAYLGSGLNYYIWNLDQTPLTQIINLLANPLE